MLNIQCFVLFLLAYGKYISQIIRYTRAGSQYTDFIDRSNILTSKLLNRGYQGDKLNISVYLYTKP